MYDIIMSSVAYLIALNLTFELGADAQPVIEDPSMVTFQCNEEAFGAILEHQARIWEWATLDEEVFAAIYADEAPKLRQCNCRTRWVELRPMQAALDLRVS